MFKLFSRQLLLINFNLLYFFSIFCEASVIAESENGIETSRQIGLPTLQLNGFRERIPCKCKAGTCKCCTGNVIQWLSMKGCMEVHYVPEDFSFELKMKMNDVVLYKNKVTGKNPPPICMRAPYNNFVKLCFTFYDIYFFGENMHMCMDVGGYLRGFELFSRSFDCLRFGAQGVKIVKPEEGFPIRPGDVIIDEGDDDEIEDYDENVVRSVTSYSNRSN